MKAFPTSILASAWIGSIVLFCASTLTAQSFAPLQRITGKVDENQRVTLSGNTHPAANAKNDRGRVTPDLPMSDLILVLSRDSAQQAAFEQFVASQYDANSTNFHQWLTPEQVGENFGPSDADIATVSNWLTSHGFSVDEVSKNRLTIRFSGKASQVENAFHTEMHNLEVNGKQHIGNMSDPQIPAALAPVVLGVKALHNFTPKPAHHMGSPVTLDATTGRWKRLSSDTKSNRSVHTLFATQDTNGYLVEDVAPFDFATIYNILPLWNASAPIDGTGQTIAIDGTSDINPSDVAAFRSDFGLPVGPALIQKTGNGIDPGECTATSGYCTIDDLIENSLDVEWSGSVAKNAQIVLVASGFNSATAPTNDPVYDSASYVVNANPKIASILNVSYGECEWGEGTAGNVSYYDLWQTAASEGIAVFVAAGDSGSASCDDGQDSSLPYAAEYGLSVSGLASTPYNTAVGGTDLYWCPVTDTSCATPAAQYWNTANTTSTQASAKGYVPEVPWNDTCAGTLGFQFIQSLASQIHVSGVNDAETACNFAANGRYEREVNKELQYDMAYLVDIVGGSGGSSGCVVSKASSGGTICTSGSTSTGITSDPQAGGNNASQASIPLYNNGWPKPSWQTGVPGIPSDGVRDLPDVSFFASDGFLGSAYLICVTEGGYSCAYSDKNQPFAEEVGGTSVATPAMAGVMALINQKTGSTQGLANKELYLLGAKQASTSGYSSCSAESVTTSSSCYFNDIDAGPFTPAYNNAVPCDYGAFAYFSYNCAVVGTNDEIGILGPSAGNPGYNAGTGYDLATGLGSLNVANVVNAWTSTSSTATGASTVTVTPTPATISTSQSVSVAVTVASSPAGKTTPTGYVTLSGGGYTSSPEPLTAGSFTFTIPAGSLSGGTDSLTVSYSGDSIYAPSSGSGSVTVSKLNAAMGPVSFNPSNTILSNQTLMVLGTVNCSGTCAGSPTPTGTVTVSSGTYTSQAATLSSGNYSVTITPNTFAGSGTVILTIQYSGDNNYNPVSATTQVNVTYFAVLAPTVTVTPTSTSVDSGSPLQVTVTVNAPIATPANPTPTGSVTLAGSGYASSMEPLTAGAYTFTIPANTLASTPANTVSDTLTASYQGDPNYAQALGTTTLTVTQSGFSLAASAATPSSVAPGASATTTVSVTSPTDYTGTVTFTSASCVLTAFTVGLPAPPASSLPTCALTGSGAVTVANGVPSGTVTYTVSSIGTTTAQLSPTGNPVLLAQRRYSSGWFATAGGSALAALFLFLTPIGSRKGRKMLCAILLMAAVTFAAVGCGGGGSSTPTFTTPTVTVAPFKSSIPVNSSLPVTVTVASTSGGPTPTGTVVLNAGQNPLPQQTLSSGSASFTIPATLLTVGSETLTASYSGDNSEDYNPATGSAMITVSNVPTPAGTYTFTVTPTANPTVTPAVSTTFTVTVN